jgi:hypothetical protein
MPALNYTVKERPILFSGEMVRAILDGNKIQTRRVIVPQPPSLTEGVIFNPSAFAPDYGWYFRPYGGHAKCPYGQPGDRLWVRETWCNIMKDGLRPEIHYKADAERPYIEDYDPSEWKWRPSIHMPRCASRINLLITNIRVERVQDISEEDAKAEGVVPTISEALWNDPIFTHLYRWPFALLWDAINEKRGYGWDVNPFVWVIEFTSAPRR